MAVKKSLSEVQELLKAKKNPLKKPVLFSKEIDELKKGEGLHITTKEWTMKTTIPSYFYGKYNKDGKKVIKCTKLEDGYIVEKL